MVNNVKSGVEESKSNEPQKTIIKLVPNTPRPQNKAASERAQEYLEKVGKPRTPVTETRKHIDFKEEEEDDDDDDDDDENKTVNNDTFSVSDTLKSSFVEAQIGRASCRERV